MFTALALLLTASFAAIPLHAQSQKPLTNADVVQMVKSGFDDATIIKTIQVNGGNFDVSVPALVDLKNNGVSQNVIDNMLSAAHQRNSAAPAAGASPASPAATASAVSGAEAARSDPNNPLTPHDPGIYWYEKAGASPQLVRMSASANGQLKTSGGFTSTITIGMSKSRTRMIFPGPAARLRIATGEPVFYVYSDRPLDYKLARLDQRDKERQLEIAEQGRSSSAIAVPERDLVPFATQPVGPGISKIVLQNPLPPGEYCFFQGVPTTVYDFGVDKTK